MYKRIVIVVLLSLGWLGLTQVSHAQEAPLKKCQQMKDRIEKHNELRRRGGGASEMARWKRLRRADEDKFRQLRCRDYGRELR